MLHNFYQHALYCAVVFVWSSDMSTSKCYIHIPTDNTSNADCTMKIQIQNFFNTLPYWYKNLVPFKFSASWYVTYSMSYEYSSVVFSYIWREKDVYMLPLWRDYYSLWSHFHVLLPTKVEYLLGNLLFWLTDKKWWIALHWLIQY